MSRAALCLCLLGQAPLAGAACPMPAPARGQDGVQAAWMVQGEPIAVGRHFEIEVRLCPAGATLDRVDAHMPEHRHGMNYRPSLRPLGDGRWRVEGLMFHMPGRWELRLDIRLGADTVSLRDTVQLQ